ncbi:MAG: hypothetical protein ABSE73_15490 [Planctomycetota bacterium]
MSFYINYDELASTFNSSGALAGLESCIAALRAGNDPHALFRLLLLQKRHELGLPLLNPGNLSGQPERSRAEYKAFVDAACREVGARCLEAGDAGAAWRYFSALNEPEPVRAALEKLAPKQASDEALKVALEYGVHPRRGFQLTLERDGLGRAISLFETGFTGSPADRHYAAGLLARAMYKELVLGVCRAILERETELPPERELVDLVLTRKWLFEAGRTHADPQHIAAVSRIGLLAEGREELIMSLSVSEYGRLLSSQHRPATRVPFEDGFDDHARYARALLGQKADEAAEHFRAKLPMYQSSTMDTYPAEMVILLFWRIGRKDEALDLCQNYLGSQLPELPGTFIPSFYELCAEAKSFHRWTEAARQHDDVTAWTAARIMESNSAGTVEAQPAPAASPVEPAPTAGEAPAAPQTVPAPEAPASQPPSAERNEDLS